MLHYEQNKLNLLNKQCFYRNNKMFFGIKSYTQHVSRVLSFGLDAAPESFFHSFIPLPMIRCSKPAQKFAVRVSSRCNCYKNHAADSKPI